MRRSSWGKPGIGLTREPAAMMAWSKEIVCSPSAVLMNTTYLHNYNTVHLAAGAPESRDGQLFVSDAPGRGIEPSLEVLGEPVAAYN